MPKKPFVDFRDIRSRITMEQVLQHYRLFDSFQPTGRILIGPCPIHKGASKTQFHVDTEKNSWTCFSECKHGGNSLDFIAQMEDVPIHDAALLACEWFAIPLEEVQTADEASDEKPPAGAGFSRETIDPPTTALKENAPNKPLTFRLDRLEGDHPFLTQECGLSQETIIDFGLGYYAAQRGMMVGCIVIPVHNIAGEVVAYIGHPPGERSGDLPKYKIPVGFDPSQEVFNLDRARQEQGRLVIVQDFLDAIRLYEHGCRKVVALMGNAMSATQEELICLHTEANSQILLLMARPDIAVRLSAFCYVRAYAFASPEKRVADLTSDEIRQLLL